MKSRILAIVLFGTVLGSPAWGNHPVLVEGNCDSPVPGSTIVEIGTCGDFDGDGRIGTSEDTDGADRIFGTLKAALGPGTGAAAGTGANLNGTITIVTSGRFHESLVIGPNASIPNPGNVTITAAPGVLAQIDAVFQGDPAGLNTTRQNGNGISIVDMPADRRVTLKNLIVRNFAVGVYANGTSRVSIVNCEIINNLGVGLYVQGSAQIIVDESYINANGFRIGGPSSVASPGAGALFQGSSTGVIFRSQITQNAGVGLGDQTTGGVNAVDSLIFGNNPNF